jgi:hypothetical protein
MRGATLAGSTWWKEGGWELQQLYLTFTRPRPRAGSRSRHLVCTQSQRTPPAITAATLQNTLGDLVRYLQPQWNHTEEWTYIGSTNVCRDRVPTGNTHQECDRRVGTR